MRNGYVNGAQYNLTKNTAEDAHPAWSPTGDRIIFTSNRGGIYFQIYTMRTDGTDVRQVGVVPNNNAMFPRYSPDGNRIAFMRASTTEPICEWNWDVWVMDADGRNQRRVTTLWGADLYPTWTPDGTQIVYASCRSFLDFDLYAVNPDTGVEVLLTNWAYSDEWGATFSPDAEHIAFNTDFDGNIEIYIGPTAGGAVFNFTQNSADDLAASWRSQEAPPPAPRTIAGKVTDGHHHPLPGVFIGLLTDVNTSYVLTTTTDSNGNYTCSDIPLANTYKVRVILRDSSERTRIHWGQYGLLVSADTQSFSFLAGQTLATVNIDFGDALLDSAPIPVHDLDDLAVMFYHSQQVNEFVHSTLGEAEFQPTDSVWGFSPTANVFYSQASREVNIDVSNSQWNDPDRPMNREWHENFHRVMHGILTFPPYHPCQSGSCATRDCVNGDCNHQGYANHCTVDSWVEGWAGFWPCVLWDTLGYPNPQIYRMNNTRVDFEYNWKPWESQGPLSREEFAVASLLWDLYDPLSSADSDYIDLTAGQIWNVIGSKTYSELADMKDVYDAFVAAKIGSGDSDADGLSDLDELMIAHGIFADTNDNHSYDPEEEIGRAANGSRPDRRNTPHVPNAYILVSVEDTNGDPASSSTLVVSIEYEAPNNIYNYSYEVSLAQSEGSMVPLLLPPVDAPSSANITAKGPCGDTSDVAYTINNSLYWQEVLSSTTGYAEEVTFVVKNCFVFLPTVFK